MEEIFAMGNGTRPAFEKNGRNMKRKQILKTRTRLSLGDLILAVSSCTNSSRETVATVADLLASGQVRLQNNGRFLRARVC
jgi:aconitase A